MISYFKYYNSVNNKKYTEEKRTAYECSSLVEQKPQNYKLIKYLPLYSVIKKYQ